MNKTYKLSEILNIKVVLHGKRIGKLADLIVEELGPVPHIVSFLVRPGFGDPDFVFPIETLVELDKKIMTVNVPDKENYRVAHLPEKTILLKDSILNKKVLDVEGREVSVVFNVTILQVNKKFYLSEVDFGRRSFYQRLGLLWLADLFNIKDESVSWTNVQHLPEDISGFKGDVKLKALKETLADLPPADMADILEELPHEQRKAVFSQLDAEEASDALEEIEPSVQRQLIAELDPDTVVRLISLMTPAQAADVVAVVPHATKEVIYQKMDTETVAKIQAILNRQEESILSYSTHKFITLPATATVGYVEDNYASLARDKSVTMYVYVTDAQEQLVGVVDIKEILLADNSHNLGSIMTETVVSFKPETTLREAYEIFIRYGFRAIPVVDSQQKIVGTVPEKDIINLRHRFIN